jgi:hypothetical protein
MPFAVHRTCGRYATISVRNNHFTSKLMNRNMIGHVSRANMVALIVAILLMETHHYAVEQDIMKLPTIAMLAATALFSLATVSAFAHPSEEQEPVRIRPTTVPNANVAPRAARRFHYVEAPRVELTCYILFCVRSEVAHRSRHYVEALRYYHRPLVSPRPHHFFQERDNYCDHDED